MRQLPRSWWIGGAVAFVAVVLLVGRLVRRTPHQEQVAAPRVWEPLSRRVEVEVLNAGGVAGAGRAGMLLLRRAGLDVVFLGNADSAQRGRDRNQVIVRRADTAGVGRVVEALGEAEVVRLPDSARLVDLSVLLGRQFRVPKGH